MSAVLKLEPESARDAVQRLFAGDLHNGYRLAGLHRWNDAEGRELFRVVRLAHPERDKVIRPMFRDGGRYRLGKPERPAAGWPLYVPPYPLIESDPIIVCEGEACADALARLGLTAVTSGSASSAGGADWAPLAGKAVRLWPDNDTPGHAYADAVAARLRALGCVVERIDVAALHLPAGGDVVDWLAANPDASADDVRGLMVAMPTVADSPVSQRSAPEPLRRPVPPPQPYPLDELGPILGPACASLRRVIQAPDAVCGASVLAAASLAAQGLADVVMDGRVHPLSLWMLTVAASGERKSAVDSESLGAVRDFEKELTKDYDSSQFEHSATLRQWEVRKAAAEKQHKDGSGLAEALKAIGPAPPAPLAPYLIVGDFTTEGIAKLLIAGWPALGAFTDEAALVFGGHGMTQETVMRTAGTLSKLWDKGVGDRIRGGDGAVKLYGRRLAMHLMAQPVIAERALSDDVLAGQGFLARCLIAWPESTAGSRPYRAENLRNDPAMIAYHLRIDALLRKPLPLAQGQRNELDPPRLNLTPEAAQLWAAFHNGIEAQMKPGGRFALAQPWASKTPEQALRIAGVLALLEDPEAQMIDAATIERASELALWHLDEAVRLAGTAQLSAEVQDAEALLNWCHETGRGKLHSRDALRLGPARIRERSRFTEAMDELVRAGWAIPVDGGAVIDGAHRRHVWRILPADEGR